MRLEDEIVACRRCPRLVAWREQVAAREARGASATRTTGAGRCPASATRRRASRHRRPRARRARRQPHRPDVHRRPLRRLAVRRAAPGRASPTSPRRSSPRRRPASCTARTSPRRSAAPRPPTSRRRPSATTACPTSPASSSCCGDVRVIVVPRRLRLGRAPAALLGASVPEAPLRPRRGGRARRRPHPARLLPPEPAEHLHRRAHRGDDRRRDATSPPVGGLVASERGGA